MLSKYYKLKGESSAGTLISQQNLPGSHFWTNIKGLRGEVHAYFELVHVRIYSLIFVFSVKQDIKSLTSTRKPPRDKKSVCAVRCKGRVTKGFDTLQELVDYIYAEYGSSWQTHISTKSVAQRMISMLYGLLKALVCLWRV